MVSVPVVVVFELAQWSAVQAQVDFWVHLYLCLHLNLCLLFAMIGTMMVISFQQLRMYVMVALMWE